MTEVFMMTLFIELGVFRERDNVKCVLAFACVSVCLSWNYAEVVQ